ncbi:MAG: type VI secretion system baseplate subunit TssG [Fibrobacter sp.]|jgi:type VI secretion system protein ImpH|nr:type VI secretion system baseplate subunit TssG [Fibrobacter sp.]
MPDLITDLQKRGCEFDAFQILVMLEEYFCINAEDHDSWNRLIRLSANPEIAFPCSDVENVTIDHDRLSVVLSFLGLVGISSPLPNYFTEYGATHSHQKSALTDFLNIFDNRLYALFFQAWKKCYPFSLSKNDISLFLKRQNPIYVESKMEEQNLPYCYGLTVGEHGNINCLIEMISDYCEGVKVSVEQWCSQWVKVDCLGVLGVDLVLSDNIVLGERITDRSGKFSVILELDRSHSIQSYNSGSGFIDGVSKIIGANLPQYLEYDVKVKFTSENMCTVKLGADNASLGIDSICGEHEVNNEVYWIVIPGKN